MSAVDPSSLQVAGGAGSVQADYQDMTAEAAVLATTAEQIAETAMQLQRDLADPDLVLSAPLDPAGAARYEALMAQALDGPSGLAALGARAMVHADAMRAAVWAYETADRAGRALMDELLWSAGYAVGLTAPIWAPAAVGAVLLDKALGGDPGGQLQTVLAHNTWLVNDLVDASPGILDGLAGDIPLIGQLLPKLPPTGPGDGAFLLGLLYPDGHGEATSTGDAHASTPPTDVQTLLEHLNQRNEDTGTTPGSIDIQKISTTGPDGQPQTRWIVDLPGTSAWPGPGRYTNATDDGTDFHSLAGQQTAYEQGIESAMKQAGIPPGDPVMLVGHSQGGMVAVQTANDAVTHGTFNVTDVVTAGSPVARMPVPSSVHVLSLENTDDIVPTLDGAPNVASANHITVSFAQQNGSIGGNHDIARAYVPGAAAVDDSTDPSLVAWRHQAAGFFSGTSATTQAYQVTRHF